MTSPEVQRHAIQEYADRQGITITEWVEGIDESGSNRKSAWWPKLEASITRVEAGEADTIIVWKFSRVGRQRLKWALALDRVDVAGGSIESATEQTDATPSGRFARGMLGELNAYQAELIGETWREAHQRRVRAGLPATGGARFGYQIIDGKYQPDPETAPSLTGAYYLYLAGAGYMRIARALNERGHHPRETPWTLQGLVRALDSGFAAGLLSHTTITRNGKRHFIQPWERDYSPGIHEPIIDDATWNAYLAARKARATGRTRAASPYLLSGLMRCGHCDGGMHGKRAKGIVAYHCTRATVTTGLRKVSIAARIVEAEVEAWLFSLAEDADAQIAAKATLAAKRDDSEFVRRRAESRIRKADERLATLTIRLADGTITEDAYRVAAETIQEDKAAAKETLRAAATNPVVERAPVELPKNLSTLWASLTISQRNLLLRPLLAHVIVAPARHRGDTAPRCTIVPRWETD